jgi:hypothetical protein
MELVMAAVAPWMQVLGSVPLVDGTALNELTNSLEGLQTVEGGLLVSDYLLDAFMADVSVGQQHRPQFRCF